MCLIVDANRMGMFLAKKEEDVKPIHEWLETGRGKLVYSTGHNFDEELGGNAKTRLAGYMQAGLATLIPEQQFMQEKLQFRGNKSVQSDDLHVLALAKYCGARILFTADRDLMKDFTNKDLIDKPRGKVYSGKQNAQWLQQQKCKKQSPIVGLGVLVATLFDPQGQSTGAYWLD